MDDDGLFDEDPALDYILYEEVTKEDQSGGEGGGCLSVIAILVLPFVMGGAWMVVL